MELENFKTASDSFGSLEVVSEDDDGIGKFSELLVESLDGKNTHFQRLKSIILPINNKINFFIVTYSSHRIRRKSFGQLQRQVCR